MARVELERLRKVYDNGYEAVHDVTLSIDDGEFVVLVGPSGCGKSTTLRMIAGLESISSGTLQIGDRVVNDVAPKDRDIAMVFQNYALYPHMDVFDNMAFGLKLRKLPKDEIRQRVEAAARTLGLETVLDRKPKALSGGQRQRVALGRAIVRDPAVFLFDEPLSNLDAKLRVQTRTEISKLHRELGATMVYVTHDQVEAMTMGDRIVVLHDGHVQQVAAPLELYDRPANTFVAGFIGSPAMNFVPGSVIGNTFTSTEGGFGLELRNGPEIQGPVTLGVRPENLYTVDKAPATKRLSDPVRATVEVQEPMGNEIVVYCRVDDATRLTARVEPQPLAPDGETAGLRVDLDKVHLFDAETGVALRA
ncbi:ABC transporter ATP-binding protein [Rubrivirga sp.]|uniref:ABC transporter ATP-binding protein n=1 Tax=Rubrivirga sp. TaxID=1885344 RepID=UPI003B51B3FB